MTKETERTEEFRFDGREVWGKIKTLAKAGNIRHFVFKNKKNETIFSMTVTIGVILAILAPQIVVIVTLIALFAHCSIVIEKENNENGDKILNS